MSTQSRIGIKASHDATYDEFAKPSPTTYNETHGRVASAPTSGGSVRGKNRSPRGRASGAPEDKSVPVEYLG